MIIVTSVADPQDGKRRVNRDCSYQRGAIATTLAMGKHGDLSLLKEEEEYCVRDGKLYLGQGQVGEEWIFMSRRKLDAFDWSTKAMPEIFMLQQLLRSP